MSIRVKTDLRQRFASARDQGTRPTCLVFATTAAHEFHQKTLAYLSPEFLYYFGVHQTHKDPNRGVSPAAITKALANQGQPEESVWPYSPVQPDPWLPPVPSSAVYQATVTYLASSVEDVREHLLRGVPVLLLMNATEALHYPDSLGRVKASPEDKPTGRHALLAVGTGECQDCNYLLVRNSWGHEWGTGGYGWLPDDYVRDHLELTGIIG